MNTKHIIAGLLFIFCSFTNYAQGSRWTLEECIRYALEHNITIKQLELQKKSSEVDLNTAQNSRLPNLSSSLGQNWNFGRTQIQSGLYENQSQSNTSFSISSSVPLFTGFRIPNEIARNELDLKAAVQNLEKAKEDLALNIASLFLQVLFNKELLKINEEQLALSRYQVERTKELVRYEKVPAAQMSDIEAQVANEEVSVIQADNNLKLALLDLKQSLELEQSLEFDILTPELGDVITDNMASIQAPQAVFESAVQTKPAIKAQEFRVESAEKTLKIAESGYYPNLNLSLGYGTNYFFQYSSDNVNKTLSDQLKNNGGEYIGFSLSIPIFNRFSVRNQVRNARINIENQQWTLENTKKTLFKEIQTAYQNALAAQEKYKASGKAIKAASESFSSASARYESGKSSVFEFNEAKTRLIKSQSEEIQAKYDYIFRTKILDFYNGIPIKL
ncbi:MAG: TolC family protein [Dysgonamonadaceae bacterium]|jgi:outer membrane protein|nr:TolC family protein [Dysgonamonadaceae bacterium]